MTKTELIAALKTQIADLIKQIAILVQEEGKKMTKGAITSAFVHLLGIGSKGEEVSSLQTFLKEQGKDIYPEGIVNGNFGPLTKKAIQKFQVKYGITKEGDAGYGSFGPKTRAKVNELLSQ